MTKKKRRKLVADVALYRSLFRSEQRRRRRFQEANTNLREELAAVREENTNLLVERDAGDVVISELRRERS